MARRPKLDLSHISEIDWARFAVLVDGEGTIGIYREPRASKCGFGMRVVLSVSNADPRMMKWLVNTFGGNVRRTDKRNEPKGHFHKHWCFKWEVYSYVAHEMLVKCRPYFIIKGDQADTAIAFHETNLINRGRRGNPPELNDYKEELRLKIKAQKTEYLIPKSENDVGTSYERIN